MPHHLKALLWELFEQIFHWLDAITDVQPNELSKALLYVPGIDNR